MAILSIRDKVDQKKQDQSTAGTQFHVFVDADKIEDFGSISTRNKVLSFARSLGFNASGLSTTPQPYPVNEKGETREEMITDPAHNPFHHWQACYEVNAGIR
jgi:hypothetical protein